VLAALGVPASGSLASRSPIDGQAIGSVTPASPADVEAACAHASDAFLKWRLVPPPRRGELVRLLGEELRAAKEPLARLVTLEAGKIVSEGLGEVQEMIDICDFAVGLSRQLHGLTIASERSSHRMMEQWHPLGPVGVITAFNFPVAVWAWNAALALVCGDPVFWKPSEKTPLCAEAVLAMARRAVARFGDAPDGLLQVVQGGREVGEALVDDPRIAQRAIAQHIEDRRKRLLEDDALLRAYFDNRRADIDAARDCLDALGLALKGTLHALERSLVDQWPDQCPRIARVADGKPRE
jgi:aldehyde dehydrogenase (NAD+)